MNRKTKDFLKRLGFRVHGVLERLGVHVTPVHYYSPLASLRELRQTKARWSGASEMPGIRIDMDAQAKAIREMCLPFQGEYRDGRALTEGIEMGMGPGYGRIEAMALHGLLRSLKPNRIIEVGSGVSTYCMRNAVRLNDRESGRQTSITCIEPYPSAALRSLEGISLIPKAVQETPFDTFTALGENDLLFIDSSHIVKVGGDVNYLFLEVLPRLGKGVVVHVHDILFPYDYQRDALKNFFHLTESTLLQAFLAFNSHVEILFCMSLLNYKRPEALKEVFPSFEQRLSDEGLDAEQVPFKPVNGDFPSSIYLRIVE